MLLALCFGVIAAAQQPPVIDRELFFGDPEIAGAQLSPDGKFISFLKPWNKNRNIWVKKAGEPFSAARLVTAETKRPIAAYFWSRDAKFILFVQDTAGDENYNVFAVDPAAAVAAGSEAPPARNLTNIKGVRTMMYAIPRSDPDTMYIGLNDRDKAWHDLYKLKISTGEKTLLRKNTDRITGWVFDNKDELRLATRSADNGDTEILRVDTDGFKKIYSCDVFESCAPVRFDKDNKRAYLSSNKGANLISLQLMDPATGATQPVESDPQGRVDFGQAVFSELNNEIIATVYIYDKVKLNWKNKAFESDFKWLESKLPGKEVRPTSLTRDEQTMLISATGDREPGEVYLFVRKTRSLTLQYRMRDKLVREALASTKPVVYKSSDGLEIPAYLTLPKGVAPKNLPVILNPHGGPWARDVWGYNGFAQFFANRGYAVLQMNFRGSTGFGKKFLDAGNKEWGQKMQDDVTWGAKYLIAEGIADPKRVAIMGGSYGGYATLAGVAFTPDVYAAAVSIVGPSNLITLLESIPPYWEPIRKLFYLRMGDPSTAEGKAQLQRQSPLNSAAKIKTPLLVVQGANDPRVNKAESDQIVIALRDRGFPVEYMVAPDEGHGFARPVNNLAMFMAAEKFLAKHLGGRYQDGGSEEVTARLKEIMVDPKTVTLAKKSAASAGAPKPAADLKPGTYAFETTLQVGGQTIKLSTTTSITEAGGAWQVTDTMKSPMGEATDTSVVSKGTLAIQKRTVKQGPATVNVNYAADKVSGSLSMSGQDKPIAIALDGPLFAEGPAAGHLLACLPLADGYSLVFRNIDLQRQKVKLMKLEVKGSESVTVPAGTFNVWRAEITSAEGGPEKGTLFVNKATNTPVKLVMTMPQMGGATMTSELAK